MIREGTGDGLGRRKKKGKRRWSRRRRRRKISNRGRRGAKIWTKGKREGRQSLSPKKGSEKERRVSVCVYEKIEREKRDGEEQSRTGRR